MQLCYVVPSQPQVDDMVNVAAVLSRWHLVLHEDGSGELWRARVSDLVLRSEGKLSEGLLDVSFLRLPGPYQQVVITQHDSVVSKQFSAVN